MLIFSLIALLASLVFAVAAWRRGRPRVWIFPSDALFVSCFVFVGLAPLLNLRATTAYSVNYHYDDLVIARALFSIALMFAMFGLVWMVRPVIRLSSLMEGTVDNPRIAQALFYGTLVMCLFSLILMFVDPEYGRFRMDVFSFVSGNLSGLDYQFSRRFAYNDNVLISQIISRLRYSIFAFAFAVSAAYLFKSPKNQLVNFGILAVIFFLLSSSISKLPFAYFFLYAALIFMVLRTRATLLTAKRMMPAVAVSGVFTVLFLATIYMVQYSTIFYGFDGFLETINLALYRVFGATYDGVLQYFTVYPAVYDFAYFADSSVFAFIFDKEPRDIILEVPVYFLGESEFGKTTTPTIFIGGAYASLGYIGVVIYSLLVATFAAWVDYVISILRQSYLRVAVYATMMLNIVFFSMIAAPTVLLTYGCLIIPVAALFLDGQLLKRNRAPAGGPVIAPTDPTTESRI